MKASFTTTPHVAIPANSRLGSVLRRKCACGGVPGPAAFLVLGTSAQANLLLREAAHFVGVRKAASDSPCPTKTCSDACGNSKNGEAWIRLVKRVARL